MIEEWEQAIIAKLTPEMKPLKVDGFPDNVKDYAKAVRQGAVLVGYAGSRYGKPKRLGLIVQDREPTFEVQLLLKGLRGHSGAYPYIDKLLQVLTGFKPPGCEALHPVEDKFVDTDNALWIYAFTFETKVQHVEALPASTDPPFTQATLIDQTQAKTTEVTSPNA